MKSESNNGELKSSLHRLTFSSRFFVVLLVLLITLVIATFLGSERLAFFDLSDAQRTILFEIRLPRIFLAGIIGAALAMAGASYQSLLRNPLAEPYLLGVSNGAALGTMVALVFFASFEFARPILAFFGAMGSTLFVYQMAKSKAGMNTERLVLSGVIVTTFLSSLIVLITSLLDATKLRSFTFWLLGDLTAATKNSLIFAVPVVIIGLIVLLSQARSLNLLMLGERDAFDFGVEVKRVRLIVFLTASALVGMSVSVGGSVGYVGLVVPHIVRLSVGSDNRNVILFSALVGAIFVIFADTIARTAIAPRELPVGAITALVGAPLFIYLLRKS